MARRHWLICSSLVLVLIAAVTGCAIWAGKAPPPVTTQIKPDGERSRRLLALSGREAAKIDDVDTRLTKLLNLADAQIQRGWPGDAHETLASAGDALRTAGQKLTEHARMSGWISLSELSRRAGDLPAGNAACDSAVVALRNIEDPARRCEYVIGTANELQYLQGKPRAIALVDESAEWTLAIDDVSRRRQAMVGFASALFNLDAFDAGERMIRQDADAQWRSETLAMLSSASAPGQRNVHTLASQERAADMPSSVSFGRELSYDKVFRGQKNSQTVKE